MSNFLPGFKTYLGLAFTLLAAVSQGFGWTWWGAIEVDVQHIVYTLAELAGLAFSAYGRAVAKPAA